MIYRTAVAFIFALFLTQIAHALPRACSDHISPASQPVQHRLPYGGAPHIFASVQSPVVTYDPVYDNPDGSMNTVACSSPLQPQYPYFDDIPNFPYIGGAYDVEFGSPNCGACWNLTNSENGVFIYLTAIDRAANGFNIGVSAYNTLKGDGEDVTVDAVKVPPSSCGF
jgi:hypothetical protein